MRLAVLIPCYNTEPWSSEYVERLSAAFRRLRDGSGYATWLVFVDDGSTVPGTELEAHRRNLESLGCTYACTRHWTNRGQGAALQTALEIARGSPISADHYVTMDADGQHQPEDLPALLAPLREGFNIVFGNRFASEKLQGSGMPASRRWLLTAAARFDRVISGIRLSDSHNGFRAFDRKTALLMNIRQDRMAHATEIKQIVSSHRLRYGEVPVHISYSQATLARGQGNIEALNIVRDLARSWWLQ